MIIGSYTEISGPGHVHTERLCLRRPRLADLGEIHEIHADPDTNRFDKARAAPDPDASAVMLGRWEQDWSGAGIGYWTVRDGGEGAILGIGGVRVAEIDDVESFELYGRFRPSAWGRGYATEVASAAFEAAARIDPKRRVVAVVSPDDEHARRLTERMGMAFASEGRDGSLLYVSV